MHRHLFLTIANTYNLVFVLSLSYNEMSVSEVCYLASKSSLNTSAAACFKSILMADCLVCGWDMYGDNRLEPFDALGVSGRSYLWGQHYLLVVFHHLQYEI